jgi:hypothetical protein
MKKRHNRAPSRKADVQQSAHCDNCNKWRLLADDEEYGEDDRFTCELQQGGSCAVAEVEWSEDAWGPADAGGVRGKGDKRSCEKEKQTTSTSQKGEGGVGAAAVSNKKDL